MSLKLENLTRYFEGKKQQKLVSEWIFKHKELGLGFVSRPPFTLNTFCSEIGLREREKKSELALYGIPKGGQCLP